MLTRFMTPELEQIKSLIDRSRSILITTRANARFDEVAACLAWDLWLKKMGKDTEVVIDHQYLTQFHWLPGAANLLAPQSEHRSRHHYVLRIKTAKAKLAEFKYQVKDSYLEIQLATKGGSLKAEDVETLKIDWPYDLVIVVGASDFVSLGQVYTLYQDQLPRAPIINIDRRLDNRNFGQLNWVNVTAASLTEMCCDIMKDQLDANLAQLFLVGLIAATESFQSSRVAPETLLLASKLMVAGAKRDEIVLKLYRTRDMATLKLWGKLLSRLKQSGDAVYSFIARDELPGPTIIWSDLCEDLIFTSPDAQLAVLFYQLEFDKTVIHVAGREIIDLTKLLGRYQLQGGKRATEFSLALPLPEAQKEVLQVLGEQMKMIRN
ncbi:MAG: hypothetical protein V1846_03725 [Candidatus Komeilibacteria bacterium]